MEAGQATTRGSHAAGGHPPACPVTSMKIFRCAVTGPHADPIGVQAAAAPPPRGYQAPTAVRNQI
jgi:hypothetical protein